MYGVEILQPRKGAYMYRQDGPISYLIFYVRKYSILIYENKYIKSGFNRGNFLESQHADDTSFCFN